MFSLNVPVVFCTFNRYDITMKVFAKIRDARPRVLYLVSDAPRQSKDGEAELVRRIRNDIEDRIDWDCTFLRVYSDQNMGCAKRISSALDFVFEREDSAIILEDDCYPADCFFEFCQTMLKKYKYDERIMSIGGSTVIDYKSDSDISYFFTTEFCCCGWATWKRAWELFDYDMNDYPVRIKEKKTYLRRTIFNKNAYWNYMAQWRYLYNSKNKDSWAYIFLYESFVNEKLNILSSVNLIDNLGFDKNATHTNFDIGYNYVTSTEELVFPLKEPSKVERNLLYDKEFYRITQRAGLTIRIKELLGLEINKRVFERIRCVFD